MQYFLLQLQKDLLDKGANVICDTVEDIWTFNKIKRKKN